MLRTARMKMTISFAALFLFRMDIFKDDDFVLAGLVLVLLEVVVT